MSESPERPRMTRRQLRELEQARQEAAESQDLGAEADATPRAAQTGEDVSLPPPPVRPTMTRRQLREAAEREAAEREAARRAELAQRAQEAPPPALETEDTPRVSADPVEAQRAVEEAAPAPAPVRSRRSVLRSGEEQRPGFFPAPEQGASQSTWQPEPAQAPVTDFAAGPVVQPPPGVSAIRTVEETGELSPVLHTAPGESQWPSIPGVDEDETDFDDSESQPLTPSGTPVPFRAPAWGARTSPTVAADEEEEAEPESISGMRAAPSIWPAGGAMAGSASNPSTGSVFPGAASGGVRTSTVTAEPADYEDDEDEEYEPMFTWLRLLVLMIIAFVLGALVWLIIERGDANGAGVSAASVSALIYSKIPLGD